MGKVFKALNRAQLKDEAEAGMPNVIESTPVQPPSPMRDLEQQVRRIRTDSSLFEKNPESDSAMHKIDEKLVKLLSQRSLHAILIGRVKRTLNLPTYNGLSNPHSPK